MRYGSFIICDSCHNRVLEAKEFTKLRAELVTEWDIKMDQERAELHTKFFLAERIAIKDMDDSELRARRKEVEAIVVEGKAKIAAIDQEARERQAKKTGDQKAWLVTNDFQPDTSDAINAVKVRKERMSKADKLLADMKKLGIANADELINNVVKAQSGGSKTSHTDKVTPGMFDPEKAAPKPEPDSPVDEIVAEANKQEAKKTVDFSKLSFLKKASNS